MHTLTQKRPLLCFWLLTALMKPEAEASVLTQLLVFSLLASYRGSTKLCLQDATLFCLFCLCTSSFALFLICFPKLSSQSTEFCKTCNYYLKFVAYCFIVHLWRYCMCCNQNCAESSVSLFSPLCPFLSMGVFEVCAGEIRESFKRSCSGFWRYTGHTNRSRGQYRSEPNAGAKTLCLPRVKMETL